MNRHHIAKPGTKPNLPERTWCGVPTSHVKCVEPTESNCKTCLKGLMAEGWYGRYWLNRRSSG